MRKFTFLFALMVTMVTVAMAQDVLVETKATRNPAESALDPSKSYYLQGVKLDFAEAVTKASVEEYGKIVDADGVEVAKLKGCLGGNGVSMYATPYSATKVTTPGTYKVIVYKGVIFSTEDEKEYQGGEYVFTVAKKEPVIMPLADEGFFYNETLTSINDFRTLQITVAGVAEVKLADGAQVTMATGDKTFTAALSLVEQAADTTVINIEFPEYEYPEGRYTIDVPAGLFFVDGVANEAFAQSTFTYSTPKLKITRDFDSWESYLTETWQMPKEVVISISNAQSVTVADGMCATISVGGVTYNSTVTLSNEENNYWVTFNFHDFEAQGFEFVKGDYVFTVPAGLYTVNGTPNEQEGKEFTYGDPLAVEEFSVVAITPAVGKVDSLACIDITFSNGSKPGILVVTKGEGDELVKYNFIAIQGVAGFVAVDADYNVAAIKESGTYTLDLSELEGLVGDKVFSWTIGDTAVDEVSAEGGAVKAVYDLTGHRVEKITKDGIYVINGVKKVVK